MNMLGRSAARQFEAKTSLGESTITASLASEVTVSLC